MAFSAIETLIVEIGIVTTAPPVEQLKQKPRAEERDEKIYENSVEI